MIMLKSGISSLLFLTFVVYIVQDYFTKGNATTMDHAQVNQETTKRPERAGKLITASVLMGVAVAALTGCSANADATPKPSTSTSAEATPTPEETRVASPEYEAPSVEALEIPAGLSDEEVGELIVERLTTWNNAGATDYLRDRVLDDPEASWESVLTEVTEANKVSFADAMFVDGYEADENLNQFVNGFAQINYGTLDVFKSTEWNDDGGKPGYERSNEFTGVEPVVNNGTSRVLNINYTIHDNAAEAGSSQVIEVPNNTLNVTLETVGDKEVITTAAILRQ